MYNIFELISHFYFAIFAIVYSFYIYSSILNYYIFIFITYLKNQPVVDNTLTLPVSANGEATIGNGYFLNRFVLLHITLTQLPVPANGGGFMCKLLIWFFMQIPFLTQFLCKLLILAG